ncbi:MAG: SCO family protein [Acidobacteriota bacterium]
MTDTQTAAQRPPRRLMLGLLAALWTLLVIMVITYFSWQKARSESAILTDDGTLPVLMEAPEFALTNRDGSTVANDDLLGQPWVADFIFTRCPGICPVLSERMQELADQTPADGVRWVSISVDPEHDTPEVLQAYAEKLEAKDNWLFLTGATSEVTSIIKEGFKLVLDPTPMLEGDGVIVHSNRFVLVDADGKIRGYYNAFEADELAALREDLASLMS